MAEPSLTYKRGEGWVYESREVYRDCAGKLWYIELREPDRGEHWCWSYSELHKDTEGWVEYLKNRKPIPYEQFYRPMFNVGVAVYWATFIPAE